MKICMISQHPPFDIRAYYKIRAALKKQDNEVHYLSWIKRSSDMILFHSKEKDNLTYPIISFISDPSSSFLKRGFQSLKAFQNIYLKVLDLRPDLIYINSPFLMPLAIYLKLRLGIPWIYDIYEDYYGLGNERFLISWLERNLAKDAIYKIATTDSLKEKFGDNNKSIVIYNSMYIVQEKNQVDLIKFRKHLGFNVDDFIVSYIGAISPERGLDKLVLSMNYIKNGNVKLLIVGGPSDQLKKVTRLISDTERIRIISEVPFNSVPPYYYISDLGVIPFQPAPNHIKTLPNKLFEYIAYGIPVLVSNIPEYRRAFPPESDSLCFVDSCNPLCIADKINDLSINPRKRANMVKNAKNLFTNKYSWEIQELKLKKTLTYLSEKNSY